MDIGGPWVSRPATSQRPEGHVRERVCEHGPPQAPLQTRAWQQNYGKMLVTEAHPAYAVRAHSSQAKHANIKSIRKSLVELSKFTLYYGQR